MNASTQEELLRMHTIQEKATSITSMTQFKLIYPSIGARMGSSKNQSIKYAFVTSNNTKDL